MALSKVPYDLLSGTASVSQMPAGSVVKVQNDYVRSLVSIANSGSGRVYADLLTISYTPVSASNKIVLIGTSGLTAFSNSSAKGAFGIVFLVNNVLHDFGPYPWYNGTIIYPVYPPDTTISVTINVPTGSAFDIKLRGYSYNESVGTMTPQFNAYSLTVMEVAV